MRISDKIISASDKISLVRPFVGADVQVWALRLEDFAGELNNLSRLLSGEEKKKAESFHFVRDRERFIVCRGLLRALVAEYIDAEADKLSFFYGPHGKPKLMGPDNSELLYFNMAHSHNLASIIISRDRKVGIDVEYVRYIDEMEQIVEGFFNNREKAIFADTPDAGRQELFFRIWTRKEAYLKGVGEGLSRSLAAFSVLPSPGEQNGPVRIVENQWKTIDWIVTDLDIAPGFAAACAVAEEGQFTQQAPYEMTNLIHPDKKKYILREYI